MSQLDFRRGLAVIEVTLHLPVTEIELPLCPTVETRTISAPAMGERAAEVRVPATKYSRHEINYLRHILTSPQNRSVCLTRSHQPIWATKRHKSREEKSVQFVLMSLCALCAFWWLNF